ncbi:hypothetical protein MHU86_7984 [Fragilaria crotonensis]|nr:hypothetical protein MHU86_7984 [Fragilaria crotonensis]
MVEGTDHVRTEQASPHVDEQLDLIGSANEHPSTGSSIVQSESAPFKESVLFFFSAAGCTIGWTAVLSNLVYYSETLGVNSFLFLNFAVFTPLLPITLAQAIWDAQFDRRFRSLRSFSFRGTVGFSVALICVLLLPWASQSLLYLSITSIFLGLSSAVLHGTLKQMATFVYPRCGRSSAAVTAGMQASGLLVLAVSLTSGFGRCSSKDGLHLFYYSIAALLVLCCCCFQALFCCSQGVVRSMQRRDSLILSPEIEEPLLSSTDDPDDNNRIQTVGREETLELSFSRLWRLSWPVCFAIVITIGSSMSVASLFNRVKSQDSTNTAFPQILFYTRLLADLVGRPATLYLAPTSIVTLIVMTVLRLGFVPLFLLYTSTNLIPQNDVGAMLGVFAFSFSSGYLVTLSYQLAPALLSDHERERNSMKQANLINVCFSLSVILGLILSVVLSWVLMS